MGNGHVENEAARKTPNSMEGIHEVQDEGRSSEQGEKVEE